MRSCGKGSDSDDEWSHPCRAQSGFSCVRWRSPSRSATRPMPLIATRDIGALSQERQAIIDQLKSAGAKGTKKPARSNGFMPEAERSCRRRRNLVAYLTKKQGNGCKRFPISALENIQCERRQVERGRRAGLQDCRANEESAGTTGHGRRAAAGSEVADRPAVTEA